MKTQVEPDHYYNQAYDSKDRFISYWHQINEITKLKPASILEIGIGNSFLLNYLKQRGHPVTSVDIDTRLNPDVASSIINLPFCDESFDVTACFELLEHLPYSHFLPALKELHRVSKRNLILSLPDLSPIYPIHLFVPKIGELKILVPLCMKPRTEFFDAQHYWEIGRPNYEFKRIIGDIIKVSFRIERTFRVFEMPQHRFFVLKKN